MDSALYQAFVRAGRTLGAALIATAITTLPQAVGIFELKPEYTGAVILAITTGLNFLGKLIRGSTVAVSGELASANPEGGEKSKASDKLPF